jgi:hypothetical protein
MAKGLIIDRNNKVLPTPEYSDQLGDMPSLLFSV